MNKFSWTIPLASIAIALSASADHKTSSLEIQKLRESARGQLYVQDCPQEFSEYRLGENSNQVPSAAMTDLGTRPFGHYLGIETGALRHFHTALERLQAGNDPDSKVRILAYGASHTQADQYTGYLRTYLQSRFGNGGQGFLFLGKVNSWHRPQHSSIDHFGLGVRYAGTSTDIESEPFGLLGAALVGKHRGSYGKVVTSDEVEDTRYEVQYFEQPGGGAFELIVDGKVQQRIDTQASSAGPGYFAFELPRGKHVIRTRLLGNGPVRLFGLTSETDQPGIVVDTLGIGGTRMADHLKWDESVWRDAVRRRNPDLITFAYGTNEAMPGRSLSNYEAGLRSTLTRMRKVAPEVSCVLIGPFDVRSHMGPKGTRVRPRLEQVVAAQRKVAEEFDCGFWDGYAFMGGAGSMKRWVAARPALASPDYIHLTRRGYVCSSMLLTDALMASYDQRHVMNVSPPDASLRTETASR